MARLERYRKVMRNELPARFRICKKIPVDIDLDSDEEKLWNVHSKKLDELENLQEKIDSGKTDLNQNEDYENSLLDFKVELAESILKSCHFCEHRCNVDRASGETGVCGVSSSARVSSEFLHHGEEPELVPSFTIFFSGCTLKCQYCQNWDISQNPKSGVQKSPEDICLSIREKRREGARNVNWVGGDPTPNLYNILASLNRCSVNVPSVWNSNMYLSIEGMRLLFGTQDVYLTDFKYGNNECGSRFSKVSNYWDVVSRNHRLAFGDSEIIIRHLVLPNHLECCTAKIMEWVVEKLGSDVRFNLMSQYRPAGRAMNISELSRSVSREEMEKANKFAKDIGLENVTG